MTTTYEYEKGRRAGIMEVITKLVVGAAPSPSVWIMPELKCDNCTRTIGAGEIRYGHSCSAECWADMHGWPDPEPDDTFEEEDDGEEPE